MCQFVHRYGADIAGKEVIIVVTQYLFSGDGAASLGRTVEKLGGNVTFADHFFMPNNLADCSMFPIRNGEALRKTLKRAEKRIDAFNTFREQKSAIMLCTDVAARGLDIPAVEWIILV